MRLPSNTAFAIHLACAANLKELTLYSRPFEPALDLNSGRSGQRGTLISGDSVAAS
jgi:hypothetical protein